jgi:hypothetical protein
MRAEDAHEEVHDLLLVRTIGPIITREIPTISLNDN